MEQEAKEAAILMLLGIYRLGDKIPGEAIDAMLAGVEPYAVDVVQRACLNFRDGLVPGRNNAFPPEAPELIAEVRRVDALILPPPATHGILDVDYGHGRIATGHLTPAEFDVVERCKGVLPDGRNMAYLPAAELKAELAGAMRALPPPIAKGDITPHLQRMAADA